MKKFLLPLLCLILFLSPVCVHASGLDELGSDSQQNTGDDEQDVDRGSGDSSSISDWLMGRNPVSQENMEQAGQITGPIVNLFGTISGVIVMLTSGAIFVVTALDLMYIAIPFTRSFLYPQAVGGMSPGVGGMGMGMPGGMGMGMGVGGAQAQQGSQEYGLHRKWVSDEAVYCVNTFSPAVAGAGVGAGGAMPGIGMGMGMGMQAAQPTAQRVSTKSVILEYFKKRVFFVIVFAIATVLLMSSLFTDCGLNLAALLSKIVMKLNGRIATTQV